MKAKKLSIGIERHIDDLGRIVIPKEMRDKLNFEKNQIVNIKLFEDHIEIGKSKHRCLFCNKENNIKELENTSLITVDYKVGDRTLGKIGVIGPKRMNYAKVIASLDCISNHIDSILEQLYSSEGEGYDE